MVKYHSYRNYMLGEARITQLEQDHLANRPQGQLSRLTHLPAQSNRLAHMIRMHRWWLMQLQELSLIHI